MGTVEENSIRRHAKRLDLQLIKSRAKNWGIDNQLGYMILDPYNNVVIAGAKFDLDLENVKESLNEYEANLRKDVAN